MAPSPLRILFAASGEFALPTLRALAHSPHSLLQVISQPDRPSGRGRKLTPTPVARFALDHSLPLARTDNINKENLPPADILIVIAFGQKIAPHIVHHPRLGSINLHASLLPKYRGAAPINWALINGETVTGNSVIRLAQKMDAGEILAQSLLNIGELENAGELHDRLSADGAPLVLSVLDQLSTGSAQAVVQDESHASIAPKLSRAAASINFTQGARQIAGQIRGMYPWPGCRVRLIKDDVEVARLTLVRAKPLEFDADRSSDGPLRPIAPGCIEARDGNVGRTVHVVGTGDNRVALAVLEVQPEGKRPMSLAQYRNGHSWEPGMRLESILT